MPKILSLILTLMVIGLIVVILLYVASVIIPFFLILLCGSYLWMRFRPDKAIRLFSEKRHNTAPDKEIIDVEYEVVDNQDKLNGEKQ